MRKTYLKRILVLIIVFMMFISTPISVFNITLNNPYAYAATTFTQDLESELFLQTLIPTLIAAGLVFKTDYDWDVNNGSQLHEHIVIESLKEYFENLGSDYKPPNEPDGPDLGETIKKLLRGGTLISVGYGLGKNIVEIPQMFWELIKSFVDDNYDEGENIELKNEGWINGYYYELFEVYYPFDGSQGYGGWKININDGSKLDLWVISSNQYNRGKEIEIKNITKINDYSVNVQFDVTMQFTNTNYYPTWFDGNKENHTVMIQIGPKLYPENPISESSIIYGTPNIVDNPNYDWNNNYTDTKIIPIPIEMDPYGNPKTDENGYYLPSTDIDEWLDVQPTEIPNLDPTGTPIPDIPPFPDIENPDNDEKTGIMIYIGNILQLIVGHLSKIAEGVKTIVSNTNQLVFNTPNPVFDPTTGEQIDPETGQPVVPEPEPATGDGIIGDGIDTNIPTDFEWGDFKHLLDIFFIFIYFIVILILILLKFLNVVFMSLPSIPANTELFNQYPEILEGVNFVKNLKVGGMSITVQQSFEMIFLIFFFIFAIKQIRKLYGASVFEQAAESKRNTKDMKMDYYENSQHYSPNNFSKGMLYSQQQDEIKKNKSLYNDDDYENIHFDGF